MDKLEIENWIKEYQLSNSPETLKQIINEISIYIRHFPRMAFSEKDEDALSDFYAYFYNRIEKVIISYDFSKSSFWTFLSKALSNSWFSFKAKQNSLVSYEELTEQHSASNEMLGEPTVTFDAEKIFEKESKPYYKLIIKLYFFDYFSEQDLVDLKEITQKSYGECLEFISQLMDELSQKRERSHSIESRLHGLYAQILKHQSQSRDAPEWNEDKQKKLDTTQDQYIKNYRSVIVYPSFKSIADFLSLDTIAVSNIIHRFKNKVKKTFKNKNIEDIIKELY